MTRTVALDSRVANVTRLNVERARIWGRNAGRARQRREAFNLRRRERRGTEWLSNSFVYRSLALNSSRAVLRRAAATFVVLAYDKNLNNSSDYISPRKVAITASVERFFATNSFR